MHLARTFKLNHLREMSFFHFGEVPPASEAGIKTSRVLSTRIEKG